MPETFSIRHRKPSEDGYMLLVAMFLLFVLAISLTIAAPLMAKALQRDRETEAMQRGKQYARAIQLYYRKFGAYPPSVDALVKTNNIRFLRKRYVDPLTGKDDWKTIAFGQNKAPLAMGFFGEPLAGGATSIAGIGPSGGNTQAGAGLGTSSTGTGTSSGGILGSGSLFGSSQSSTSSTTASSSDSGSTSGGSTTSSSSQNSASGTSQTSSGTTSTGTSASSGLFGSSTSQTFGGAGIVGVEPPITQQSILIYKKKNHYNEWEFTYSPLSDQMKRISGNTGTIGQSASSLGSQPGSPGFSSSSSSGTTTTSGSSMGASTSNSGSTTQSQQ